MIVSCYLQHTNEMRSITESMDTDCIVFNTFAVDINLLYDMFTNTIISLSNTKFAIDRSFQLNFLIKLHYFRALLLTTH